MLAIQLYNQTTYTSKTIDHVSDVMDSLNKLVPIVNSQNDLLVELQKLLPKEEEKPMATIRPVRFTDYGRQYLDDGHIELSDAFKKALKEDK